ncbi:MAG: M6 family metalloprotease domain-containing protein [Candidatus Latescibacteria bacterium]|nr:M6 family metalloprotease domain-containing protein [Candidatus Latescibacterota bacterium]
MKRRTSLAAAALLLLSLGMAREAGAVYLEAEPTVALQPDGSAVKALIVGDEYYSRLETEDGYTIVRDGSSGYYCYAELSVDASELLSTGIRAGSAAPLRLDKHLDLAPAAMAKTAADVRASLDDGPGDRWRPSYGAPHTGTVVGVTVLVDFADLDYHVERDYIERFFNEPGFDGNGTNGSVRDFFLHVSGGHLDYSNVVSPGYIQADEGWGYWSTHSISSAGQLVTEVLQKLDSQGFDFSAFDADGDGRIDAINILTEGPPMGNSALHPHADDNINVSLDGLIADYYQIHNIGPNIPYLGGVVHENGHMLCDWPDLYFTGSEEGRLGTFCLMGRGGGGYYNGRQPNAYLKYDAGWLSPIVLGSSLRTYQAPADANVAFRIDHPDRNRPEEFYIIENRQSSGYDEGIPDSGLAIYHIDESRYTSGLYVIDLVEADGEWTINGDDGDLWSSPEATAFNFSTDVAATWYDGEVPGINLSNVGPSQATMSFSFQRWDRYAVAVDPQPNEIIAPWSLTGPGSFSMEGGGYTELALPSPFSYTVDFFPSPLYGAPVPASVSKLLWTQPTQPIYFTSNYALPFGLITGGGLADTGSVSCANAVDVDGDGVAEVYVGNLDGAGQLLEHQGNGTFTDIAPSSLSSVTGVKNAAWADVDNDGDSDVFLVRGSNQHALLVNGGSGFTEATGNTPEFAQMGDAQTASWADIDADGLLDLFITRFNDANLRFDAAGGNRFVPGNAGWATLDSNTQGCRWGDYNRDGYLDLFVTGIGAGTYCRGITLNNAGTLSHPGAAWVLAYNAKDACWSDFNNDGLVDVLKLAPDSSHNFFMQWADPFDFEAVPSLGLVLDDGATATSVLADDFDNDGFVDLFVTCTGGRDFLAINRGDHDEQTAYFDQVYVGLTEASGPSMAAVACDFDGDGGMDIFVGRDGVDNYVLRNEVPDRGHWLNVSLAGSESNASAIGATVEVYAGEEHMLRQVTAGGGPAQRSTNLHFGLGSAQVATLVAITWPGGGTPTYLSNVTADQQIAVTQPTGGKREAPGEAPATAFEPAYPNPFNPKTTLSFSLESAAQVSVAIYSVDGRQVVELVNERLEAGEHSVTWTGRDAAGRRVSSGAYLCRVKAGDKEFTSRLTLLK